MAEMHCHLRSLFNCSRLIKPALRSILYHAVPNFSKMEQSIRSGVIAI